ncbi:hypothetical protein FHG87_021624 [Trinorchestia longiramus]|nr:hypothetical protein FHG87_021624 [Trinorchestia longiramus]
MFAIKRYFAGRKRRNSSESLPDVGVTCTCSANKCNSNTGGGNGRSGGRRRRDVSPSPSLGGLFGGRSSAWNGGPGQESPPPGPTRRDVYRRSISLGQILQADPHGGGGSTVGYRGILQADPQSGGSAVGYRGTLTSAGSSDVSPDSQTDGRELTEFEKENLLFLKDLDNSYHNQEPIYMEPYDSYRGHHNQYQHPLQPPSQFHRPLSLSRSNASIASVYSDESTAGGESTPQGSSPFGTRRSVVYSPSRAQTSYLLRSTSREEEECRPLGEEVEERIHPAYRSDRQPGARTRPLSGIPVPTSMNPVAIASAAVAAVNAASAAAAAAAAAAASSGQYSSCNRGGQTIAPLRPIHRFEMASFRYWLAFLSEWTGGLSCWNHIRREIPRDGGGSIPSTASSYGQSTSTWWNNSYYSHSSAAPRVRPTTPLSPTTPLHSASNYEYDSGARPRHTDSSSSSGARLRPSSPVMPKMRSMSPSSQFRGARSPSPPTYGNRSPNALALRTHSPPAQSAYRNPETPPSRRSRSPSSSGRRNRSPSPSSLRKGSSSPPVIESYLISSFDNKNHSPTPSNFRNPPVVQPNFRNHSPTPPTYRNHSPTPPTYRNHSPTPPTYRNHSPTPPTYRNHSPTPPTYRNHSPTPPTYRNHSPTPPTYRNNSPTPPAPCTSAPAPSQIPRSLLSLRQTHSSIGQASVVSSSLVPTSRGLRSSSSSSSYVAGTSGSSAIPRSRLGILQDRTHSEDFPWRSSRQTGYLGKAKDRFTLGEYDVCLHSV